MNDWNDPQCYSPYEPQANFFIGTGHDILYTGVTDVAKRYSMSGYDYFCTHCLTPRVTSH